MSTSTSTSTSTRLPPFTLSLLSGAFAGTTVDTTLFPLDTLKTRLQSSSGFFASGGFRGIYSGLGPVVLGSAPSAALFFITYDSVKRYSSSSSPSSSSSSHTTTPSTSKTTTHMLAATLGELSACIIRVPTELLKQRAQAGSCPNSLSAWREIWALRTSSSTLTFLRELYRGGGITIMREIPFTIIQFPLWESGKRWWGERKYLSHTSDHTSNTKSFIPSATPLESAIIGSLSGGLAALLTTPLDVLKTRIMLSRHHLQQPSSPSSSSSPSNITKKPQTAREIFRELVKTEGPSALMKGWAPRVMWISIGGAIFLGAYDAAREVLEAL